jgi:cytidylate kinase
MTDRSPSARPHPRTIAVDGPAGAGKSTVGQALATALGHLFFDTGVLYRALTLLALEQSVSVEDGPALAALVAASDLAVLPDDHHPLGYRVQAAGRDVTPRLRDPAVDAAVSAVSRHAAVRAGLLPVQRWVGQAAAVVMVGRDIGTVVLPDADLKIYLAASAEVRARRRFREQLARAQPAVYAEVLAEVRARDARDAGRAVAPLAVAAGAVVVDTDACRFEEVVDHLLRLVGRWPDALTTGGGAAPCRPEPELERGST